MNEINSVNLNKIQFKGNSNMQDDNLNEVENFSKFAVENLSKRAEREVPENGDFAPVVERFVNHNPEIYANELLLQVTPLPVSLKNEPDYNKLRYLQAVVKSPLEQPNRCVLACGTKQEILHTLSDENLSQRVAFKFEELADDLRNG